MVGIPPRFPQDSSKILPRFAINSHTLSKIPSHSGRLFGGEIEPIFEIYSNGRRGGISEILPDSRPCSGIWKPKRMAISVPFFFYSTLSHFRCAFALYWFDAFALLIDFSSGFWLLLSSFSHPPPLLSLLLLSLCIYWFVCVCVCVCVREREREKVNACVWFLFIYY